MGSPDTRFVDLEQEAVQDHCGVAAVFSYDFSLKSDLLLKLGDGVQHRGQGGCGSYLMTNTGPLGYKQEGYIRNVFTSEVKTKYLDHPSKWALLHARYPTQGSDKAENVQPCEGVFQGRPFAVIHNGEFPNLEEYRQLYGLPQGVSDSYIFTQMVAQEEALSFEEAFKQSLGKANGSYAIIAGFDNALYLARDPHGIRSMVIGKQGESIAVASESCAFLKAGVAYQQEVKPGEIVKISDEGIQTIFQDERGLPGASCALEYAYLRRPESEGIYNIRYKVGKRLAEQIISRDKVQTDSNSIVVGIPDSGLPFANGLSVGLQIPSLNLITRDHYSPNGQARTFMQDNHLRQGEGGRERMGNLVQGKLSFVPDKDLWKDKAVFLGDDSIVRGTTAEKITGAVRSLGASKIYWALGFPPVFNPCHLGVSMRSERELVARTSGALPTDSVWEVGDKVAKQIGADGVFYISPYDFAVVKREVLGNGLCLGCANGEFPINRKGEVMFQRK